MDKIEEMRKNLISAAKKKVQEKYGARDVHIIKSVNLLGDLDGTANLLTEQLREWYSVHFPELGSQVADNMSYLKMVHYIGKKSNFTGEKISQYLEDKERVGEIVSASKSSIGSDVAPEDLEQMRSLALNCLNLLEEREAISKYIEKAMEKEMPAFSAIAGPTIGAKILAKIGSKSKLAFLPASTIQIVGAEKALFLHIKMGVKGPKFGYLYQHPLVKAASYENKGRMARSIAAKLSIAAKMDYFGSKGNADEMKKQLEIRAKELTDRKHKQKEAKAEEPAKMEERPTTPRREFSERPRLEFRPRPQYGAERSGNFPQRSGGFRNERPGGFRRTDRPLGGFVRNDRPTGFRPHGNRAGGPGSSERKPFGSSDVHSGPRSRPPWKGGRGADRRSFGNEGARGDRPSWKGGKQKRDFSSTERKAFGNDSRPQGKPHSGHGAKFSGKGKGKGDPARKKF